MDNRDKYALSRIRELLKPCGEALSFIRYGKDEEILDEAYDETLSAIQEASYIAKIFSEPEKI